MSLGTTKKGLESLLQTEIDEKQTGVLKASITYGELKADFSGTPESVLISINAFIAKQLPAFDVARRISLNFDSTELARIFENYVKLTPEGPRITLRDKLSDKELVALQLVAQKLAYETSHASSPSLSLGDLQMLTALNAKSVSSRLSELVKIGAIVRESVEQSNTKFRISVQGISWLKDTLEKKQQQQQSHKV